MSEENPKELTELQAIRLEMLLEQKAHKQTEIKLKKREVAILELKIANSQLQAQVLGHEKSKINDELAKLRGQAEANHQDYLDEVKKITDALALPEKWGWDPDTLEVTYEEQKLDH